MLCLVKCCKVNCYLFFFRILNDLEWGWRQVFTTTLPEVLSFSQTTRFFSYVQCQMLSSHLVINQQIKELTHTLYKQWWPLWNHKRAITNSSSAMMKPHVLAELTTSLACYQESLSSLKMPETWKLTEGDKRVSCAESRETGGRELGPYYIIRIERGELSDDFVPGLTISTVLHVSPWVSSWQELTCLCGFHHWQNV